METLFQLWFDTSVQGLALLELVEGNRTNATLLRCQRANAAFARLLGCTQEELTGESVTAYIPFVCQNEFVQQAMVVCQTGEPHHWYHHDLQKDQWLQLTLTQLADGVALTIQDVSDVARLTASPMDCRQPESAKSQPERHYGENESTQILEAVVNTSPTGLALFQPVYEKEHIVDFTYLLSNPVNSKITGVSQQEMFDKSLVTLFPFVRTNSMFNRLVEVTKTGRSQQFQLLSELAPGEFWGEYSITRVGSNVLLTINDITSIKRIEHELRSANLELEQRVEARTVEIQQLSAMQRAILQSAGLAITVTDTAGIIQLVNPALEELTGYQAGELLGKATAGQLREPAHHQKQVDLLKPDIDDRTLAGEDVVAAYIIKHKFLRRENVILTKEGNHIPVLSTVSGLYDDEHVLIGFVDIVTDISYLKAIEQALVQVQQRSQLATKAGRLGVWEWNLQTDELELDEHFYTFFEVPSTTRIRRLDDLRFLIHPNDLLPFNQYVESIKAGQTSFVVEFRVVLPFTNTVHYIQADGMRLQQGQNETPRMIGVIRDRTAKRRAGYALRASEQRYRSLVDRMNEVVFQTNAQGRWVYLNPAWEKIMGFSIDESLGGFFLDFIVPEDHAETRELFEKIRAGQQTQVNHEIRYIHKDGGYRWISVLAEVNPDQHNQFAGVTGTLTDITERKQAEEAIRESEQRFREIADNVDDVFWVRDLDQPRFLYMNRAFERITGMRVEELYEDSFRFLSFILEDDRAVIRDTFTSNEPGTMFKFRIRHQDGSIRWLEARVFTVKNEEGVLIRRIGVATDITTAIEKEQILEESLSRERTLNTLKSQFISTASHEFRTPLTAISSSIELIKHYVDMDTDSRLMPHISKHADTIANKVVALNDLITDTLTISKIEEGKIRVQPEMTDLVALSQEVVSHNFNDRDDKRHVKMQVMGTPAEVSVDQKLISHVLTNLLTNAFKFSTKNPELKLNFRQEEVTISITDKGIGIPKKELPNLFSKFFRASNAIGFQGTGLGLAICQEYVHLQKGCIDVDSIEGVGTTFTVKLPLHF